MTIDVISNQIIQKFKSMPVDLAQKVGEGDLVNFWEQYKEQLQFKLYLNYDIFEDNVKDIAYDEINLLSAEVIEEIFTSIANSYDPLRWIPRWEITSNCYVPPATFKDKKSHIVATLLLNVQNIASSEEVLDRQFSHGN
jgi:hypothetical protein